MEVGRTKRLLEIMAMSTKEGKTFYDKVVGREATEFTCCTTDSSVALERRKIFHIFPNRYVDGCNDLKININDCSN